MKFNFKPLSSFFSSTKSEEQKDTKDEKKTGDDQGGDQGNDEDDAGDDQGDDQGETDNETGDDQAKSGKDANKSGKETMISITQKEYKAFITAQSELEKFGKNAEDRNNFLKDATQLSIWYQAAIGAGATSNSDANAQEKNTKKESKVTRDAKAAYEKSAASKKK